jgi:hypothetical protein
MRSNAQEGDVNKLSSLPIRCFMASSLIEALACIQLNHIIKRIMTLQIAYE